LNEKQIILIVATSGRLLAQLVKKSGFTALVIDCFADLDTQSSAKQVVAVKSLGLLEVKEALGVLKKKFIIEQVIYGSGLEKQQKTLQFLDQNFTVLGNSFSVFSAIQNKQSFFSKLKQHSILYPEVSFQAPIDNTNYLVKPLAGEGGIGIKRYIAGTDDYSDCYWQKYHQGIAKSVLFVANGTEYKIIGFHKQYVTKIANNEFVFSGVINQLEKNHELINVITGILERLVTEFSLKGINSLDFIENAGKFHVLEINARPSASLNLYNSELISIHINSCLSNSRVNNISPLKDYRAYKIIFSEVILTINKAVEWPGWIVDRPQVGSIINTGEPICSIIAGGKNEQQVEDLLLSRQQQLMNLINR